MTISAGSAGLFGPKRRRRFNHRQRTENMPELRSSGGFGNGEVTEPLWASDVCDKELNYALRDSLTHPSCLNEIQSGLW